MGDDFDLAPAWAKEKLGRGECAVREFVLGARIYVPDSICGGLDDELVYGLAVEVFGKEKMKDFKGGARAEDYCMFEVPSSHHENHAVGDESNPYYRGPERLVEKIMSLG